MFAFFNIISIIEDGINFAEDILFINLSIFILNLIFIIKIRGYCKLDILYFSPKLIYSLLFSIL